MAVQTIKDRWAEHRLVLGKDNSYMRKRVVPNADGEPEQVLKSVRSQLVSKPPAPVLNS